MIKKVKFNREIESSNTLSAIKEYYYDLQKKDELIEEVREDIIQEFKKEAYQEKVNMVLKMISKNYDNEEIQDLSDFTLEEIAKIREEYSEQ